MRGKEERIIVLSNKVDLNDLALNAPHHFHQYLLSLRSREEFDSDFHSWLSVLGKFNESESTSTELEFQL